VLESELTGHACRNFKQLGLVMHTGKVDAAVRNQVFRVEVHLAICPFGQDCTESAMSVSTTMLVTVSHEGKAGKGLSAICNNNPLLYA
jgi:hypothetical protein